MKALPRAATVILQSHYHTPGPAVLAAFPSVLRAGHLQASSDYAVERRSSQGHDLLYCIAGAGVVHTGGRAHSVEAGELAWINGYEPHAHHADPDRPWELLWLRVDGAGVAALHVLLGADRNPVFRFSPTSRSAVRSCFRAILDLMSGAELHREEDIYVAFARLVSLLRRARQTAAGPAGGKTPNELEAVMRRMALYPQQPWSAVELARLAGMSVTRFYRAFRGITGSSPIDWLRRERINLAKRRLLETDAPIRAVAEQAGYNSPFFFSRDFKRHTGQSPSEFRSQERRLGR